MQGMADHRGQGTKELMEVDDAKSRRLLCDLKAVEEFEQRISLLHLLCHTSAASVTGQLQICKTLGDLWEESGNSEISTYKWRNAIIQAASSQIPHVSEADQAILSYLELSTKACEWCGKILEKWNQETSSTSAQTLDLALATHKGIVVLVGSTFTAAARLLSSVDPVVSSIEPLIRASLRYAEIIAVRKNYASRFQEDVQDSARDLIEGADSCLLKIKQNLPRFQSKSKNPTENGAISLRILSFAVDILIQIADTCAEICCPRILKACWKTVLSILLSQEGHEVLGAGVDICNVVSKLVGQAIQKLKITVESNLIPISHSSTTFEADNNARLRAMKFFIVQAVRIVSSYPKQAGGACKILSWFAAKLLACLSVQNEFLHPHLKQRLCETVWPATSILLQILLTSDNVKADHKRQLLHNIVDGCLPTHQQSSNEDRVTIFNQIFPVDNVRMSGVHGKVGCTSLYINMLLVSSGCKLEVLGELCARLDWLLDTISEEGMYSSMLQLQTFPGRIKENTYTSSLQLMYIWTLHGLQTFAIVASESGALEEIEQFLFRNAMHPCGLCAELIKDLWCFVVRHGDQTLVSEHLSAVFQILKSMCCSKSVMDSEIPIHRMARLLCSLLRVAPAIEAERIFSQVFQKASLTTPSSATLAYVCLHEGFSFGLSPERRKHASVQLSDACMKVLSELSREGAVEGLSRPCPAQKKTASCLLHVLRLCSETGEQLESKKMEEIAKVCLQIVKWGLSKGEQSCSTDIVAVVSQVLRIFQYVEQALHPDEMQGLLTSLQTNIYNAVSQDLGTKLVLRPALAEFLAKLSAVNFSEDEGDLATQSLWKLYQVVLNEQHWALVHTGLSSFAEFAASTSLTELWRFIPSGDAGGPQSATASGTDFEQMFMNDLQALLEKQQASLNLDTDCEERKTLMLECKRQKTSASTTAYLFKGKSNKVAHGDTHMQVDVVEALPSEISKALVMLREGTKLLQDKVPVWLSDKSVRESQQHHWLASQLAQVHNQVGILSHL